MAFPRTYTPEPSRPSGGPRPGTRVLLTYLVGEWDDANYKDESQSLGIYNPRDVCGNQWPDWECPGSQHARGAAGDASLPVVRPRGHPEGHRMAAWLTEHHLDLGVQEVIWAGRRWTNQTGYWAAYGGRSDHFDHVHFAQNDAGADGLTLEMIRQIEEDDMPLSDEDVKKVADAVHARLVKGEIDRRNSISALFRRALGIPDMADNREQQKADEETGRRFQELLGQ